MTPDELRAARAELGLTGAELGAIIGVKDRIVRAWEAGSLGARPAPIPQTVEIIVRLMVESGSIRRKLVTCYIGKSPASVASRGVVQRRPSKRKRVKTEENRRDQADNDAG